MRTPFVNLILALFILGLLSLAAGCRAGAGCVPVCFQVWKAECWECGGGARVPF